MSSSFLGGPLSNIDFGCNLFQDKANVFAANHLVNCMFVEMPFFLKAILDLLHLHFV
jgi:hypothetical protein